MRQLPVFLHRSGINIPSASQGLQRSLGVSCKLRTEQLSGQCKPRASGLGSGDPSGSAEEIVGACKNACLQLRQRPQNQQAGGYSRFRLQSLHTSSCLAAWGRVEPCAGCACVGALMRRKGMMFWLPRQAKHASEGRAGARSARTAEQHGQGRDSSNAAGAQRSRALLHAHINPKSCIRLH